MHTAKTMMFADSILQNLTQQINMIWKDKHCAANAAFLLMTTETTKIPPNVLLQLVHTTVTLGTNVITEHQIFSTF